jgi:hypothetical protein
MDKGTTLQIGGTENVVELTWSMRTSVESLAFGNSRGCSRLVDTGDGERWFLSSIVQYDET